MTEEMRFSRHDRGWMGLPPRYRIKMGGTIWSFVKGDGQFHKNEITEKVIIVALKERFPSARCVRSTIGYDKLYMSDADWAILEMIAERYPARTR